MSGKTEKAVSFKAAGIFLGWTLGLLVISGLLWFLTESIREKQLARTVNKVLASRNNPRRLGGYLSVKGRAGSAVHTGRHYSILDSEETGVVFVFMAGGVPSSCLAVLSPSGEINELIPLSAHGAEMLERISSETLRIFTKRIETAERDIRPRSQNEQVP